MKRKVKVYGIDETDHGVLHIVQCLPFKKDVEKLQWVQKRSNKKCM